MDTTIVVCLLLITGSLAGPINKGENEETTCARTCKQPTKFLYKPGTNYEFEYNVNSKTNIEGASEDHSELELKAIANIQVISPCDFVLTLDNVQLLESDPNSPSQLVDADKSRLFKTELEKNQLRFAFQDGEIEDLCHTGADPTWVLNIKRGVLSAFQNKMKDFHQNEKTHETDVAGKCDVEYSKGTSSWGKLSIHKTKHLLGCDERNGHQSIVQGNKYNVPSDIQALPLMKSEHECDQEISSGLLQTSVCHEQHVFRPFSKHANGARTVTMQKLKFQRETSPKTRPDTIKQRSSLLFQHENGVNQADRRTEVVGQLNKICADTKDGIKSDTPRLFTDLVYLMKGADERTLQQVLKQIEGKQLCQDQNEKIKKFFLDALPVVGTPPSVKMMTELLNSKHVSGQEANMWLTAMALIQEPTSEMVRDVKDLLTHSDNAMLAISSLVNNFCKKTNCEQDRDVAAIVNELEKMIGETCYVTDSNIHKVLISLRSLGNIGYIHGAVQTINNCFMRKDNAMQVRVAAVESMRRLPCDQSRHNIMKVFVDTEEDSELRINAYLSLMECPSENVLQTVRRSMEKEEVNQVGSFMWSHLTNLMETSDPHKQTIRNILNDEELQKEFNMDKRKFSRNYEGSFLFERLNLGGKVDSNLIWSSKSFIPRSAMVNFTVDLFGRSMNLFEVGGRVEGLEYLLESYFGPNGYFGDEKSTSSKPSKALANLSENKISTVDNNFGMKMDQIKGAMYMRVFGNELRYADFEGVSNFLETNGFNFLDLLMGLQEKQEFHHSQSTMFLDSSIIIPTIGGFPLNLTVNGTATVELDAAGKVNLKRLLSSSRSIDIDGHIRPSGAVEISGLMALDAFTTRHGLKVVSTMHSRTLIQGHIKLSNGQVLSAEWDMPDEKMEVFGFKNTFFVVHKDVEKEQKMITENGRSKSVCTGDKLATITGLELCGYYQYPNASQKDEAPYFPFTGPVNFGVTLHKRDNHKSYRLTSQVMKEKQNYIANINFDTPGATKVDRSVGIDALYKSKDKTVEVSMHSPWKQFKFTGSAQSAPTKKITGKIVIDNSREYEVTAETNREKERAFHRYTSSLDIKSHGRDPIKIVHVLLMKAKKMETELTATGLQAKPITVQGKISNSEGDKSLLISVTYDGSEQYYVEVGLSQNHSNKRRQSYQVQPVLIIRVPSPKGNGKQKTLIAIDGNVKYIQGISLNFKLIADKILSRVVRLEGKLRRTGNEKKGRTTYNGRVNVILPKVKVLSYGKVDLRTPSATAKSIMYKLTTDYNAKGIKRNRVTLNGKYIQKGTKTLMKSHVESTAYPEYSADLLSDFTHNKRYTEASSTLKYGKPSKSINFAVKSKHILAKDKPVDLTLDSQFKHQSQNIDWKLVGKHKYDRDTMETDSDVKLQYGKDKQLTGSLGYVNNLKRNQKVASLMMTYPGGKVNINNKYSNKDNDYSNRLNILLPKIGLSTLEGSFNMPKPGVYNFNSDLDMPYLKKIKVDGKVNMKNDDFASNGNLRYGKDAYSYNGKMQRDSNSIVTDGEFEYPSRQIKMSMNANKKGDKYNGNAALLWDAKNDKSKQMSFDTTTIYKAGSRMAHSSSLKYPSRTIKMSMKTEAGTKKQLYADLQWSPEDKAVVDGTYTYKTSSSISVMSGSLQFTSPFNDKLSSEFSVNADKREFSTNAKASWGKGKEISSKVLAKLPFNTERASAVLTVNTPIENFEKLSANLKHRAEKELQSSLKLNAGKKEVELIVSGQKGDVNRDISGQFEIHSNIKALKALIFKAHHKDDGRTFKNGMAFRVNARKYAYNLDMKHVHDGWNLDNKGTLETTILGRPYKTEWSHKNTESMLSTSVSHGRKKNSWYNMDVSGHVSNGEKKELLGQVTLKTPWKMLSDVDASLKHERSEGEMKNTLSMRRERQKILYLDTSYSHNNKGVNLAGDLFTTLTNEKTKMKVDANCRYNRYPMTGHAQFQWAPRRSASLDGTFDKPSSSQTTGKVDFKSPFERYEMITFNFDTKNDNSGYRTESNLSYAPGKVIHLGLGSSMTGVRKVNIILTTPFEELTRLEGSVQQQGSWEDNSIEGSFKMLPIMEEVSARGAMKVNDGIEGEVHIKTPFQMMPEFDWNMAMKKNGLTLSMLFDPGKQQIMFSGLANVEDPKDMSLTAKMTSPFRYFEKNKFTFNHKGDLNNFKTSASMELANYKQSVMKLSADTSRGLTASLFASSPLHEDVDMKVSGQKSASNINGEVVVKYGGATKFSGQGKAASEPKYTAEISIESNIPALRTVNIRIGSEKMGVKHHVADADINYNGQRSTGSIEINYDNKISIAINGKTPEHEVSMMINHEGDMQDFNTKMSAAFNREKFQGSVIFKLSPKISLTVSMDTPFDVVRNLDSSVSLLLRRNKIHGRGDLNLNGDQSKGSISWNSMGYGFEGSITLKTPYRSMRKINLAVKHEGLMEHFKTEMSGTYNRNTVSGSVAFKLNPEISLIVSAETPFDELKKMNGMVTMTMAENNHAGRFEFNLNGRQSTGEANFRVIRGGLAGTMTINTPYEMLRSMDMNVNHQKDHNSYKSHVSGSLNGQRVVGDAELNLNEKKSLILNIVSPFEKLRNLDLTLNHQKYHNMYESSVSGSYNDQKASANIKLELSNKKTFMINIESPFQALRNVDLTFSHHCGDGFFSSGFTGSLNGRKTDGKLELLNRSKKSLVLTLVTPFEKLRNVELTLNHQGGHNDKGSKTSMFGSYNGEKASAELEMNMTNEKSVVLNIATPSKKLRNLDITLTHEAKNGSYKSHVSANFNGQKGAADVTFTRGTEDTVVINIITPFNAVKTFTSQYRQQGTLDNFKTYLEYSLNYRQVHADFDFSLENGMAAKLNIETPYSVKRINSEIQLRGSKNDVNSYAFITVDGQEYRADMTGRISPSVKGTIRVKSPLRQMRDVVINLSHNGQIRDFSCRGDMTINSQKWGMELRANTLDKLDTGLTITTPVTTGKVIFKLSGQPKNFRSQIEMSCLNYKIEGVAEVNVQNAVSINLDVNTSFEAMKKLKINFMHRGRMNNFNSQFEGTIDHQAISGSYEFNAENGVSGSFILNTPFLDEIKAQLSHSKNENSHRAYGIVQYGRKSASVDAVLHSLLLEGTLGLNLPIRGFEQTKVSYKFDTKENVITFEATAQYANEQRIRAEFTGDVSDGLSGSFLFTSPYTSMIKASVQQTGTISDFSIEVHGNYGQDNYDANIALKTKGEVSGKLDVTLMNVRVIHLTFEELGKIEDFTISVEGDYFNHKVEATTKFTMKNGVQGEFELTSTFGRPIKVVIRHHGNSFLNFDESASLSIDNSPLVSAQVLFKVDPVVGRFALTSPRGTVSANLNAEKTGDRIEMKSSVEYDNNKKIEVSGHVDLGSTKSGSFNIDTPYYSPIKISTTQYGTLTNFRNRAHFIYGDYDVEVDTSFSFEKDLSAQMTAKVLSVDILRTVFTYKGEPTNFQIHADANAFEQDFQANVNFNIKDKISFEADVETPFQRFRKMRALYNLNGSLKEFTTNAEVDYEGKKGDVVIEFSTADGITMKITANTPFNGFNNIEGSYRQQGSLNNFQGHADLSIDQKKFQADITFRNAGGLYFDTKVKSPSENFEALFRQDRESNQINNHAEMLLFGNKFDADVNIKTHPEKELSIKYRTPFNHIDLLLNHKGSMKSFSSHGEGRWNEHETSSDVTFRLTPNRIRMSSSMKMPFENYTDMGLNLNARKSSDGFSGHVDANIENKKWQSDVSASRKPEIEITVDVKTPIESFRKMTATYQQKGTWTNFESHAKASVDNKVVQTDLIFQVMTSELKFDAHVKMPVENFEEMRAVYVHKGELNDFTCHAELTKNSEKIESDLTFKTSPNVDVMLSVTTPINNYRQMGASFVQKGELEDFTTHAEISKNNEKMEADLTFKTMPNVDVILSVTTPIENYQQMGASFTQQGLIKDFTIHAEMNVENEKIQGDIAFNMNDKIDFSTSVETPFENYRSMNFLYRHEGELKDFSCHSEASLNGKKMDADLSFKMSRKTRVRFTMRSPIENMKTVSLAYTLQGKPFENLVSNFEASADNRVLSSVFKLEENSMDIQIKTPFENFREMNAGVNYRGTITDFSGHFEAGVESKKIATDVSFKMAESMELIINVATPFEKMETGKLTLTHSGPWSHLENSVTVTLNGESSSLSTKFIFDKEGVLNADVYVESPFDNFRKVHFFGRNTLNSKSFVSQIETEYMEGQKIQADVAINWENEYDLQVSIKTPFQNFATNEFNANFNGNMDKFTAKLYAQAMNKEFRAEINFKNDDDKLASAHLRTPIRGYETIVLSFNHVPSSDDFRTSGKMEVNGREMMFMDVEHRGDWNDGNNVITIRNTYIDDVVLELKNYGHVNDFSVWTQLKSGQLTTISNLIKSKVNPYDVDIENTFKLRFGEYNYDAKATVKHRGFELTNFNSDVVLTVNSGALEMHAQVEKMSGKLEVKTPFENYRDMSVRFSENINGQSVEYDITAKKSNMDAVRLTVSTVGSLKRMTAKGEFSVGDQNVRNTLSYALVGDHFTMENTFSCNVLDLTYNNYISVKHSGGPRKFTNKVQMTVNKKNFETQTDFDIEDNLKFMVDVRTPYESYNEMYVSAEHVGNGADFSTKVTVRKTNMDDIILNIEKEGTLTNMKSRVTFNFGHEVSTTSELTTRINGNDVHIQSNINAIIYSFTWTDKFLINHSGATNNFNNMVSYKMFGKQYEVRTEFNMETMSGKIDIQTPLMGYREFVLSFNHNLKNDGRKGVTDIVSRFNGEEMTAKVDYVIKSSRNVKIIAEMQTPFDQAKYMRTSYVHRITPTGWTITSDIIHNNDVMDVESTGKIMPGNMEIKANLKTPFTDYQDLSFMSSVQSSCMKCKVSADLTYKQGQTISFRSDINAKEMPMNMNMQLTTPFENFDNLEMVADMQKSYGTVRVQIPKMTAIQAVVKYSYPAMSIDVTSGINGLEKIGASVSSKQAERTRMCQLRMYWSEQKHILIDSSFEREDNNLNSFIKVETPFQQIQQFESRINAKLNNKKQKRVAVIVEHNEKTVLDVTADISNKKDLSAELQFRQPHPMKMELNGKQNGGNFNGDLFLDWDSKNEDSNIRLRTIVKNGNKLRVKAVKSGKMITVDGDFRKTAKYLENNLRVTIDDQTAGYTLLWKDSGNREMCKVAMVTPWRTVQLTGNAEYNSRRNSYSGVVHWDAEKDKTQRVGAKMTIGGLTSNKIGLELELPSIGKDVKLETDLTLNNGRTIFDGTTEFTYSKKSNSLKLFSKVEDLSKRNGQNYSFTLGIAHPSTAVDIELTGSAGTKNKNYFADMDLKYLTSMKQKKNFALRGEIDSVKKNINLKMESPMKNMKLQGQVNTENPYGMKFQANAMTGEVSIDTEKQKVKVSSNYDSDRPEDMIEMSAGYGRKSIMASVRKMNGRMQEIESLLAVTLNTSQIVHTRLHWRPSMLLDLKNYGMMTLQEHRRSINSGIQEMSTAVREEALHKFSAISRVMIDETKPLFEKLDDLLEFISDVERSVAKMYLKNDFDLRTLTNNNLASAQTILPVYHSLRSSLHDLQTFGKDIENEKKEMATKINSYLSRLSQNSQSDVQQTYDRMTVMFGRMMDLAISEYDFVIQQLRFTHNSIIRQMEEMEAIVKRHPIMDTVKSKYNDMVNAIPMMPEIQMPTNVIKNIVNKTEQTFGENEIYQQGKWAWNYWNVKENAQRMMRDLLSEAEAEAGKQLHNLKNKIAFDLQKSRMITFDPEHGEIQFELYSPVPIRSLLTVPQFGLETKLRKIQQYIPKNNFSFWDLYYSYVPPSNLRDILPPFKAVAGISESKHFFTFDGKHFDFAGRCSYILAKDMMHSNFSIIANYDRATQPKIANIQVTDEQNVIEIKDNGKLKVNGRRVEIPVTIGNTTVERVGQVLRVSNRNFELDYDMRHNYYFLTVSGWYHGRLAGLLGYYDLENYNDMMTSERMVTEDAEKLAQSWEVASKCSSNKNFADKYVMASEAATEKCTTYFEQHSSEFRSCFGQVTPQEYMVACEKEMTVGSYDICNVAAMYVRMCQAKEVNIKLPRTCVQCSNPNGGMYMEGENITLTEQMKNPKVDVLFVMQESKCNKKSFHKLDNIAKELHADLKTKGIQDSSFAFMTYHQDKTYMHTVNGEMLASAAKFTPEIRKLSEDVEGDAMSALMEASRFPFRAGAKKVVVLIPCADCHENNVRYSTINRIYKSEDISLHILTQPEFGINGNKGAKSSRIYGIDNQKVYTIADKSGNTEMYPAVSVRKDRCIELARNLGSIFDVQTLTGGRLQTQKSFIEALTGSITQYAQPADCQNCRCVSDAASVGISVCQPCQSLEYNVEPKMVAKDA